jgi:hypothetical protein
MRLRMRRLWCWLTSACQALERRRLSAEAMRLSACSTLPHLHQQQRTTPCLSIACSLRRWRREAMRLRTKAIHIRTALVHTRHLYIFSAARTIALPSPTALHHCRHRGTSGGTPSIPRSCHIRSSALAAPLRPFRSS